MSKRTFKMISIQTLLFYITWRQGNVKSHRKRQEMPRMCLRLIYMHCNYLLSLGHRPAAIQGDEAIYRVLSQVHRVNTLLLLVEYLMMLREYS